MTQPGFICRCLTALLALTPSASAGEEKPPAAKAANPLVTALWFSHRHGTAQALAPGKDRELKAALIAALSHKPPKLTWDAVSAVFEKGAFQKLAGGGAITLEEMERMLRDDTPRSREALLPKVRRHADLLTTQFDLLDEPHWEAADRLVNWLCKNHVRGVPQSVVVICTGNSRRSMLGSTMGNVAAAYYGLPNVRFYSGGTAPSAFNPRTVATLKEIGVEVEPSGKEAPRGKSGEANPVYRVRWGKGLEALEFSKRYGDAPNPRRGFAAVLVCGEADASCPVVTGAGVRVPAPYLDPRVYDGAPFEAAKYAERRDDMGRFMLNVLMQVRARLGDGEGSK